MKIDLELVRFGNISRSIFELSDEEKYEHAKNLKVQFVTIYSQKDYKKALEILKDAISVIEKINKENTTEEINKFLITLLLNECNFMNNLKDYSNTVKVGEQIVKMDPKSMKA